MVPEPKEEDGGRGGGWWGWGVEDGGSRVDAGPM